MADHGPQLTKEYIVTYRDMMCGSLQREMETTKKVIAAVPDARSDYQPDPKARTAKELAWHLAAEDVKFLDGIANLGFDMKAGPAPATTAEMADWYETNFTSRLAKVRAMTAEQLLTPVDFYGVFNFPSALYLDFLNNHSIHHRGQLAVYLRPMGSKVPSIYGGSADEEWKAA